MLQRPAGTRMQWTALARNMTRLELERQAEAGFQVPADGIHDQRCILKTAQGLGIIGDKQGHGQRTDTGIGGGMESDRLENLRIIDAELATCPFRGMLTMPRAGILTIHFRDRDPPGRQFLLNGFGIDRFGKIMQQAGDSGTLDSQPVQTGQHHRRMRDAQEVL